MISRIQRIQRKISIQNSLYTVALEKKFSYLFVTVNTIRRPKVDKKISSLMCARCHIKKKFVRKELLYFSTQPEKKMQAYATLRGALQHFQSLRIFVLNECVNILNLLLNIALLKTINFSEHYFSLLSLFRSFFFYSVHPQSATGNTQEPHCKKSHRLLYHVVGIRNRSAYFASQTKIAMNVCGVCRSKSKRPKKRNQRERKNKTAKRGGGTMKT